ncbi:DUF308 domain-containing protein [Candidatus Pacearchaeota archaeon]|nr:DUF308 domain-containing protein [Candidatus Pacearchaeota archaeon]
MRKYTFRLIGIFFVVIGFVFLLNSFQLTGFTIIDDIAQSTSSLMGIVFVIGGILFFVAGRGEESDLEIFISRKALERSKKDTFVRTNLRSYMNEIKMIAANPEGRPQERIGDFKVSPRSHKNIRVAWHYSPSENRLYVDDLLYHRKEGQYIEDWNNKARNRKVRIRDYEEKGFEELEPS